MSPHIETQIPEPSFEQGTGHRTGQAMSSITRTSDINGTQTDHKNEIAAQLDAKR